MKKVTSILLVLACTGVVSCTSPKERADEAKAAYTEEKTKTLQEYKKCIKDAGGNEKKAAVCEGLLRAVGAAEGGGTGESVDSGGTVEGAEK